MVINSKEYIKLAEKLKNAYSLMTNGELINPEVLFEKVETLFNQIYIENEVAADDLIHCIITPEMSYSETIDAIKDYFGYDE